MIFYAIVVFILELNRFMWICKISNVSDWIVKSTFKDIYGHQYFDETRFLLF